MDFPTICQELDKRINQLKGTLDSYPNVEEYTRALGSLSSLRSFQNWLEANWGDKLKPILNKKIYWKDLTNKQLLVEYKYWNNKVVNAISWGAALAAASEFRDECKREILLRGLALPVIKNREGDQIFYD